MSNETLYQKKVMMDQALHCLSAEVPASVHADVVRIVHEYTDELEARLGMATKEAQENEHTD